MLIGLAIPAFILAITAVGIIVVIPLGITAVVIGAVGSAIVYVHVGAWLTDIVNWRTSR